MLPEVKKNRKGFTLMELIIVVAIIAILAAVAIPNYIGLTTKANDAVLKGSAAELANAINIYNALYDPDITSTTGADATLTAKGLLPTFDSSLTYANIAAKVTITYSIATVNP